MFMKYELWRKLREAVVLFSMKEFWRSCKFLQKYDFDQEFCKDATLHAGIYKFLKMAYVSGK
jgi:hypothetical protein